MKRGTPEHPKTISLEKELGIPNYQALGILEGIAHWAAKYAKRGNIGKWDNKTIAGGIGWDQDPDSLISALVVSGYFDECAEHRLVIHDWDEHCDQTVKRASEVKQLGFVKAVTKTCQQSASKNASTQLATDNQESNRADPALSLKPKAISHSSASAPLPAAVLEEVEFPQGMDTPKARDALADWLKYKRKLPKAKQYQDEPFSASKLLKTFSRYGPDAFCTEVDRAIGNGWQGVQEPRGSPHNSSETDIDALTKGFTT